MRVRSGREEEEEEEGKGWKEEGWCCWWLVEEGENWGEGAWQHRYEPWEGIGRETSAFPLLLLPFPFPRHCEHDVYGVEGKGEREDEGRKGN